MKKAKIMLAAIIVIAVAGGSLALKAQKFGINTNLSKTCNTTASECDQVDGTATSYSTTGTGTSHTFAGYVAIATSCTKNADCTTGLTLNADQ